MDEATAVRLSVYGVYLLIEPIALENKRTIFFMPETCVAYNACDEAETIYVYLLDLICWYLQVDTK